MVILLNFLLTSFLGKCPPFFTILSSTCILESGHPGLGREGEGRQKKTHSVVLVFPIKMYKKNESEVAQIPIF